MASQLRATPRSGFFNLRERQKPLVLPLERAVPDGKAKTKTWSREGLRIWVSNSGDSYLDLWNKAVDNERKTFEFQKIVENPAVNSGDDSVEDLEKKTEEFNKILEVSKEERDRVQRMQVIDRAAAAIAAARAILKESGSIAKSGSGDSEYLGVGNLGGGSAGGMVAPQEGKFCFVLTFF